MPISEIPSRFGKRARTPYDGVHVALVEALDTPLLTYDERLAAAAGRHVRVTLV